jgi:hypothetical protein
LNKEALLTEINTLLDNHVESMACYEKVSDMINLNEVGILTTDYLLGKTDNPFQLRIYAWFSDKYEAYSACDYKKEILEVIADDPGTYKNKAYKLAIALDEMAKEIRDLI